MIKKGDEIRFLNKDGYYGFNNFEECHGVVEVVYDDGSGDITAFVFDKEGEPHENFVDSKDAFFYQEAYEKIEAQE